MPENFGKAVNEQDAMRNVGSIMHGRTQARTKLLMVMNTDITVRELELSPQKDFNQRNELRRWILI